MSQRFRVTLDVFMLFFLDDFWMIFGGFWDGFWMIFGSEMILDDVEMKQITKNV